MCSTYRYCYIAVFGDLAGDLRPMKMAAMLRVGTSDIEEYLISGHQELRKCSLARYKGIVNRIEVVPIIDTYNRRTANL